jgi:glycerol-3-phosphate dehydrogenase
MRHPRRDSPHDPARPASSSLNSARRARELAGLPGQTVDVLVVGLGATGAAVALDAASRGLSVAAIDAHDLAFGTSRWSSKLIHGGLRYLASGQVDLAYESAVERGVLMRHTAPHLVRALPFVMPLTPMVSRSQALLTRAGLCAGDVLRRSARTGRGVLPGPRHLSRAQTLGMAPALRSYGLRGGLLSWDGQVCDDARLVTAIARTAAAHGARIITHCRALSVSGDGGQVRDELTGEEFTLRARSVINAAGVWAGQLAEGVRLRPSRGTHLVLRAESLAGAAPAAAVPPTALQVPVPGETNRFLLVLPQGDGRVYVGLTDEPADGPVPDVPEATEPEIGFLLDILGGALDVPVRRADVIGAFAGLRPLLDDGRAGDPTPTSDLSRRHAVLTAPDGLVTVVGGKLTTTRRVAQDAVDAVAGRLGAGRCRTGRLPLLGAADSRTLSGLDAPRRLVRRYGSEATEILALGREDPALLDPVAAGLPVIGAELVWAVRHEGAITESDVLDRRTRIGLVRADREAALPAARRALSA